MGLRIIVKRYRDLLICLGLFLLALVPRAASLQLFSTADEGIWLDRTVHFLDAVGRGDWKGTLGGEVYPAVTMHWLGSIGLLAYYAPDLSLKDTGLQVSNVPLVESFRPSLELLGFARYPTAALTALFVVAVYLLVKKGLGRWVGLLAAVLVCFDPYFMALSRALITDNVLAIFSLLSVLCLALALSRSNWPWYVASGAFAGLAFLSKSPALVLVPLALVLTLIVYLTQPRMPGRLRSLLVGLVLFCGAMILCVFALWPSMWVQPSGSIRAIFATALASGITQQQTMASLPVLYLTTLLFRQTPAGLLGAAATLVILVKMVTDRRARGISLTHIWVLSLWGMAAAYLVLFSVGAYGISTYVIPCLVALDVLGAIGLVWIGRGIMARWPRLGRNQAGLALVAGVAVVSQAVLCLAHYPYYLSYFNPALGGVAVVEKLAPDAIGHGEGLDQILGYFNAKDNAASQYVGTNVISIYSCVELEEFRGHVMPFPSMRPAEIPERQWAQLDYVVFYRHFSRFEQLRPFTELLATLKPEFVAKTDGIELAWVYKMPKDKFLTLPAGAKPVDATYENGLKLAGYRVDPLIRDTRRGRDLLPVTLYWRADQYCNEDYQVVFKLRNAVYTVWGSKDVFPACQGWKESWRHDLILPDYQLIEVLPGTPPGSYTLDMLVINRANGREMQAVPTRPNILGEIEIPQSLSSNVKLLDIEHPINARLSNQVMLLGYNIQGEVNPGKALQLTLFWQPLAATDRNHKVFVHVVDQQGAPLAQRDGEPVSGFYPTSRWQVGEIIRDQYEIPFTDDSGEKAKGMRIGMYEPATGERLPVTLADGTIPEDRAIALP